VGKKGPCSEGAHTRKGAGTVSYVQNKKADSCPVGVSSLSGFFSFFGKIIFAILL
jgi:hypothetical protein